MNKLMMTWERMGDELVCRWVECGDQGERGTEETVALAARLSEPELVVARAA